MSERSLLLIYCICSIEQFAVLSGSAYLIGWRGWSPWLLALTIFIMAGSSPSYIIKALVKWKKA